jgi:4-hydroxybenzoate polyprenyltransferase
MVNCFALTFPFFSGSWTMLYGDFSSFHFRWLFTYISTSDTIYACQDKRDDVKMGVRSTALLFGSWIRPLLISCGIIFVTMLAVAGVLNKQGPVYFIVAVGGTAAHLVWQFMTVDLDVPASCWSTFRIFVFLRHVLTHGSQLISIATGS